MPNSQVRDGQAVDRLGRRKFTFAVIADTHVNQGEDECNSPFEVNRLANGRLRHVVRDLNTRDVAFVLHLGDIVHPVPAFPDLYEQAVREYQDLTAALNHKVYLVPGNHDVGDKPNDWAPAGVVCEEFIAHWRRFFGENHYAFEQHGCHFIVLDAQILNSDLPCETEQRRWLEAYLQDHRGARIFIGLHYPPYLTVPDEPEHYDNIAEPARTWLLKLLERHGVEALFAGHVHNFWYDRHGETEIYLLPSTAFVRQDYSEMHRQPPGADDEAGRNDKAKLGYFLIHVHEQGHYCEVVRTYGRVAKEQEASVCSAERIASPHPLTNRWAPLGFDMRQSWLEHHEVPPTGGLDEFDRKIVRNDYPLMALWEMGVRKLRIPLQDIRDARTRRRLRLLTERGFEFSLFSYGVPRQSDRRILQEIEGIFSGWEIGYNRHRLDEMAPDFLAAKRRFGIPLYLSPLLSRTDVHRQGERYYHTINHGFRLEERDEVEATRHRIDLRDAIDGFVFRLTEKDDPWHVISSLGQLSEDLGTRASVHLRVAGANPAAAALDDHMIANRVAEALFAALTQPSVSVFVDTFADSDRGYFVRNGVVDRVYNPRPAFFVVRHLYGALASCAEALRLIERGEFGNGDFAAIGANGAIHALVKPARDCSEIALPRVGKEIGSAGRARVTNLLTGEVKQADYRRTDQGGLVVTNILAVGSPVLLSVG